MAFPTLKGRVRTVATACKCLSAFYHSFSFAVWQKKVCGTGEIGIRTPSVETQVTPSLNTVRLTR